MPIGIGMGLGMGLFGAESYGPSASLDLNFASSLSLTASVGPTPSYSRASTGTFFNSSGVLSSAAVNAARFDHVLSGGSWVSKGLLVEEQRTNLALYSEQFNNAAYSIVDGVIAANQIASPDGTTTADKLTAASGTVIPYAYQGVTTASSAIYSFSIYVKKNTHDFVQVVLNGVSGGFANFNISTGVVGTLGAGGSATSAIVNVGNGWYRCSVTYTTANTSGSGYINIIGSATAGRSATFSAAGTESVYIWGQQLELGSFPTSYIPTTSASVTRSADVCQITGTNFSGFYNQSEGSFAITADTPAIGTLTLCAVDDNTANESIIAITSGTDPKLNVVDGGSSQASIDAGSVTANAAFNLSSTFKVNDFAASIGGAAVVTDTSGTMPTPDRLRVGSSQAGEYANGHISRIRYYNSRLTNATLVSLST